MRARQGPPAKASRLRYVERVEHPRRLAVAAVVVALLSSVGVATFAAGARSNRPGEPRHAKASAGTTQADLRWQNASAPTDFPITKYVITSVPTTRSCVRSFTASDVYLCAFSNLKEATKYTFVIRAFNKFGAGPPAVVVLATRSATTTTGPSSDEFADPSPNHVPTPSKYNTTSPCAPTAANYYQCTVAPASQPPRDLSNPETYLNSAYWPAEKRPDIEMYAIQKYGYAYENCAAMLPHYCFLVDAQAVGYPISNTPQVGDLWIASCAYMALESGLAFGCPSPNDWYMGYIEQVLPDGSFIQSWGGSDTVPDTGLSTTWMSASMDPHTDFIGFFAPGKHPKSVSRLRPTLR